MADKEAPKFYVHGQKKYTLSRPRVDEKGEPIQLRDPQGNPRYKPTGEPILAMRDIRFRTIVGDRRVGQMSCVATPADDQELAILKAAAKDPDSMVMDEATFKKSLNAAAWDQEQRAAKAESENKVLVEALDGSQKRIEELEKQLAEAKGKK